MNYYINPSDKGTVTIKFGGAKFSEVIRDMLDNPNLLEELDRSLSSESKNEPKIGEQGEDGWFYMEDREGKPFYLAPKDAPEEMNWWEAKKYASSLSNKFNKEVFLPSREQLKIVNEFIQKNPDSPFATTFNLKACYWSSSERNIIHSWNQQFSDGAQSDFIKHISFAVRCARR